MVNDVVLFQDGKCTSTIKGGSKEDRVLGKELQYLDFVSIEHNEYLCVPFYANVVCVGIVALLILIMIGLELAKAIKAFCLWAYRGIRAQCSKWHDRFSAWLARQTCCIRLRETLNCCGPLNCCDRLQDRFPWLKALVDGCKSCVEGKKSSTDEPTEPVSDYPTTVQPAANTDDPKSSDSDSVPEVPMQPTKNASEHKYPLGAETMSSERRRTNIQEEFERREQESLENECATKMPQPRREYAKLARQALQSAKRRPSNPSGKDTDKEDDGYVFPDTSQGDDLMQTQQWVD